MSRVVILSGVYPDMRCGVAYHTWVVAQAVARLDTWEVHVVTSDRPEVDRERSRNFELHPVVEAWSLWGLPAIIRHVERLQPSVLHIQNPTAAYAQRSNLTMPLLPLVGRRLRRTTRIVVTQHDLAIGHWLMQRKHGLLLKRADAITVSNDRDYQAVGRLSASLLERTHVAHLASLFSPPVLEGDEKARLRSRLGLPADGCVLLYFGFILPSRRIDTLVRAAGLLQKQRFRFRLVLMGGVGPGAQKYAEDCRRLARQLDTEECVLWTGYVPKERVEDFLAVSDMLVSPIARGADLRNSTIVAAASAGLPIITTRNTRYGTDRELEAWGFCRFFDPGDPEGLATAAVTLFADEEAKEKLRAAMAKWAALHTWEAHARVLDMAYRGLPPEPYDPGSAAGGGPRRGGGRVQSSGAST